jgi:Alpha/beta hydrolase family
MDDVVLLHSPLVGPSTLIPTARALEALGVRVFLPSPSAAGDPPRWRDWPQHLLQSLPPLSAPIVVGHSMAGLLAARVASALRADRVVCLDANMPPETGPTPPVDAAFQAFLRTLPIASGVLPPWHEWWPVDVFNGVPVDAGLRDQVLSEVPRLRLDWFDDAFEMPDWSRASQGYIRTSPWFDREADRAEARGWPTIRLDGTHLHPTTHGEETARAIMACTSQGRGYEGFVME